MFPQTPAAKAARSVATRFYSPALLNHCVRSYLWGGAYAGAHAIAYDDELYYVSAMLHDIALTDPFDSHKIAFEEAGGDLAWVFGTATGWSEDRAARAREIIVLHMRDDVAPTVDPESHLLQVATSWDVVGLRPEEFPASENGNPRPLSPNRLRRRVRGVIRGPGATQARQRRRRVDCPQRCAADRGQPARRLGRQPTRELGWQSQHRLFDNASRYRWRKSPPP
jgi:hypothetical protein